MAPTAGAGATTTNTSRFAAACGALSWYVKAAETARALRAAPVAVRPLLPLMPGADVDEVVPESREDAEAGTAPSQLTIVYGGRVLMLDDVPADKAAGLLQAAAAAREAKTAGPVSAADLPAARKASLHRFMQKRKGRIAARGKPYLRPDTTCGDRADELALAL